MTPGRQANEPVITRANDFLTKTQHVRRLVADDFAASQPTVQSLIPITGAESEWAVFGLVQRRIGLVQEQDRALVRLRYGLQPEWPPQK